MFSYQFISIAFEEGRLSGVGRNLSFDIRRQSLVVILSAAHARAETVKFVLINNALDCSSTTCTTLAVRRLIEGLRSLQNVLLLLLTNV